MSATGRVKVFHIADIRHGWNEVCFWRGHDRAVASSFRFEPSPPSSVLRLIYLYTEGGDAPGWPGAKSEHIGNIRAREEGLSAGPTGRSAGRMYRYIERRTLVQ